MVANVNNNVMYGCRLVGPDASVPPICTGCPGNAFNELEHQHVLCCTICSMIEKVRIYPIPGGFQQGQSLPLELTNDNT